MSKNLKSKKVNKRCVPEPRESSVFRDSYAYERFTDQYILRIRIWLCYTKLGVYVILFFGYRGNAILFLKTEKSEFCF